MNLPGFWLCPALDCVKVHSGELAVRERVTGHCSGAEVVEPDMEAGRTALPPRNLLYSDRSRSSVGGMAAEETSDLTNDTRAEQCFRAESRHSTLSPWRKGGLFVSNLVSSVFTGSATWPPVDIVLVELSTGSVVRRWHEGGEEAAGLLRVLSDDLVTMAPDAFIDKWDLPVR